MGVKLDEAVVLSDDELDRFTTLTILECVRDNDVVKLAMVALNLSKRIKLLNELRAIEQEKANGSGEARA